MAKDFYKKVNVEAVEDGGSIRVSFFFRHVFKLDVGKDGERDGNLLARPR
jgi:hypothetical protein